MLNNTIIGLEIGKSTIKLVLGNSSMGKLNIKKCKIVKTPDNAFLPNDSIDKDVLSQYLRNVFKENKLKRKKIHISLNTDKTVLRERVLPKAGLEELREISKFEIEQFLPYSVNDFVVDYRILNIGTDENEESLNALVAAVPRDIIDSYVFSTKKCGCAIKSIDIYSDCLSRFMEYYNVYPEENVLIVDIGARMTHLTIFKDNKYFANFNSDFGGDEATKILAEENSLEAEEAEHNKIELGLAINKDLFDVDSLSGFGFKQSLLLNDFCDSIGSEISRVMNFFRTRKTSGIIHKVVLLGGGSEIKEMDKYLQGILGVEVEYFKLPDNLNMPKDSLEASVKNIGRFVPAIGAALRGRHQ